MPRIGLAFVVVLGVAVVVTVGSITVTVRIAVSVIEHEYMASMVISYTVPAVNTALVVTTPRKINSILYQSVGIECN